MIHSHLERVNENGVIGIWSCKCGAVGTIGELSKFACSAARANDDELIKAIEGEDMTTEDDQVTETIDFAAIKGPTEQLVTMAEGLEASGLNRATILVSYLGATIVVKHLIGMDDDDFRMLVDYFLERARLMPEEPEEK